MKRFFTAKRIIWFIVIILLIAAAAYLVFGKKDAAGNIQTDLVKKLDLTQTVLATGQVVSGTDLSLSFQTTGTVKQLAVKEGGKVKAGQFLAALDMTNALASLTTARGALAQAQANYEKVLAGASGEEIKVAEKAVDAAQVTLDNANASLINIKAQQDTAVQNAYATLLNTSITAIANPGNIDTIAPTISGTYTSAEQGTYKIIVYGTDTGLQFQSSGLEFSTGAVSDTPAPLGTRGLYIKFDSNPSTADSWTIYIPNTYSSSYVTNNNAYQAALKARDLAVANAQATAASAQVALAQAQASLEKTQARVRPADVNVAKAAILSAQGQVAAAEATIANATLRAPASGMITSVNVKLGELAVAQKEVMILQDVNNLHVEADISEANIAQVRVGQEIDVTFDALGPDRHFTAKVQIINPASTIISGVVNFKVTASLDKVAEIKPGMTANLIILVDKKNQVLAVPSRAIINQDSKQYARLVDDPQQKTYHQVEVRTGLEADGGLTEIISGLNEGQEIVVYIKQ